MGNFKSILLLLCGIALCVAVLVLLQYKGAFMPMQEKPRATLLDEPLDSIERITIDYGNTRIGLERERAGWTMTAPFNAQIDQTSTKRMLDAFEDARVMDVLSFREIRQRDLSLKNFGLLPARVQVTIEQAGRRTVMLFGATTATGKECYLRQNGDEQVLIVPATLSQAIPPTADALRSRNLLRGNRNEIRGIEVRAVGRPYITLTRTDKGAWQMVQPMIAPASTKRVEALINALYDTPVNHFIWPTISNVMDVAESETTLKARQALYGLAADSGLQLSIQRNGVPPLKIVIGHTLAEEPALAYILLPEGEAIGAISNTLTHVFDLTAADLRDNAPFSTLDLNAQRMQVTLGNLQCLLAQTNAIWRFQTPFAGEANQSAMRTTLEQLMRLKADALMEPTNWREQRNMEPNLPISEVELQSGRNEWCFTIDHDNIQADFVNLVFAETQLVYRVALSNMPPALVSKQGLLELRGREVLSLPVAGVRRLVARRDGKPLYAVERDSKNGEWRLTAGSSGRLREELLNKLLALLQNLTAERVEEIGFTQQSFEAYGLHDPWFELNIDLDSQESVRRSLIVGRELSFGKRYAVLRGLDVLFVLDNTVLATLAARLTEQTE